MAIFISDGWGVAHHHVHEALFHLGRACSLNENATQQYCDYEKHHEWPEFLNTSTQVRQIFNQENKQSIIATILFQAGMEAWISWAYTMPQLSSVDLPKDFVKKWEEALSHFGIIFDFSSYAKFYRQFRNPIVHPSSQDDVEVVASIWCKPVHEGLIAGWTAISVLSEAIGYPFDDQSWETLCNLHDVPESINNTEIADLQALELDILKKASIRFRR